MDSKIITKADLASKDILIGRILSLLCEEYTRTGTKTLFAMWKGRLDQFTVEDIHRAFLLMMDGRDDKNKGYMPKSEEFAEFCIKARRLKSQSNQAQIEYNPEPENPLTKDQAAKVYSTIAAGIKTRRQLEIISGANSKSHKPKFQIFEFYDQNGDAEKLKSFGHIEITDFIEECENQGFQTPKRVIHCYDRFKQVKTDDEKDSAVVCQSVRCNDHPHAAQITIGFLT